MLNTIPKKDIVLMLEAGYIYLAMGKFSESRAVFEGVSELVPHSDIPRVAVANALFAQKKYAPAIQELKEAIELNAASAFAYSHLGEALLFSGKKEEAIVALNKAISLDAKGHSGLFAKNLLDLMKKGFDPVELRKQKVH